MKYTAIALLLMGVMVAGYAGYLYLDVTGTVSDEGRPSLSNVGLLLGFAVGLMVGGAALLAFGGKGFSESQGTNWQRRRAIAAAAAADDDAKPAPTGERTT